MFPLRQREIKRDNVDFRCAEFEMPMGGEDVNIY